MGYRDVFFDFYENGKKKPIYILHGPNGLGKTTILAAVRLVYSAPSIKNRDNTLYFKKLVFNEALNVFVSVE